VLPEDFAVEIWGLPTHESVTVLKAEIWQWVEQINEKEQISTEDEEDPY
jgi:hypothetical protein